MKNNDFYKLMDKARKYTGLYNGVRINLNEADEQQGNEQQGNEAKAGTDVDKKTEIGHFTEAMKSHEIYTNMKFNDIKIYADYVEFSGEVPVRNNNVIWLIQKECTIRFQNPLVFGSIERGETSSLSYDLEDVMEVVAELNNVISAINDYYEGLKTRIPDYISTST